MIPLLIKAAAVVLGLGTAASSASGGSSEESSSNESNANKGWSKDESGGPVYKTTNDDSSYKTEKLSQAERPHDHKTYKVDKEKGIAQEGYKGENAPRGPGTGAGW